MGVAWTWRFWSLPPIQLQVSTNSLSTGLVYSLNSQHSEEMFRKFKTTAGTQSQEQDSLGLVWTPPFDGVWGRGKPLCSLSFSFLKDKMLISLLAAPPIPQDLLGQ